MAKPKKDASAPKVAAAKTKRAPRSSAKRTSDDQPNVKWVPPTDKEVAQGKEFWDRFKETNDALKKRLCFEPEADSPPSKRIASDEKEPSSSACPGTAASSSMGSGDGTSMPSKGNVDDALENAQTIEQALETLMDTMDSPSEGNTSGDPLPSSSGAMQTYMKALLQQDDDDEETQTAHAEPTGVSKEGETVEPAETVTTSADQVETLKATWAVETVSTAAEQVETMETTEAVETVFAAAADQVETVKAKEAVETVSVAAEQVETVEAKEAVETVSAAAAAEQVETVEAKEAVETVSATAEQVETVEATEAVTAAAEQVETMDVTQVVTDVAEQVGTMQATTNAAKTVETVETPTAATADQGSHSPNQEKNADSDGRDRTEDVAQLTTPNVSSTGDVSAMSTDAHAVQGSIDKSPESKTCQKTTTSDPVNASVASKSPTGLPKSKTDTLTNAGLKEIENMAIADSVSNWDLLSDSLSTDTETDNRERELMGASLAYDLYPGPPSGDHPNINNLLKSAAQARQTGLSAVN